jgi:hypothetical protein
MGKKMFANVWDYLNGQNVWGMFGGDAPLVCPQEKQKNERRVVSWPSQ